MAAALVASALTSHAADAKTRDQRLAAGEILVKKIKVPGSDIPRLRVEAMIDAPADMVWPIVSDCNQLHKHMSSVARSRVVKKRGRIYECETEIHLPGPLSNLVSVTEVKEIPGPPVWKRRWHLLKGDYEKVDGSWDIQDFNGDQMKTRVLYTIHAIPNVSLPDFILRLAHGRAAKNLIKDIRKAVGAP